MVINILTLFPDACRTYLKTSLIGKAWEQGLIEINLLNIRDFAPDKHHTTDDTPYGGGPGMIMKIEPIDRALEYVQCSPNQSNKRILVMSARGQKFTQAKATALAGLQEITLMCGRYEGIDQRVADHLADEELSIGPYVLAGGELPALVVIEAVARLIPGVLGNQESLKEESFFPLPPPLAPPQAGGETMREYPHYTKPADYKGWKVPEVLLSGDHAKIKKWRDSQTLSLDEVK